MKLTFENYKQVMKNLYETKGKITFGERKPMRVKKFRTHGGNIVINSHEEYQKYLAEEESMSELMFCKPRATSSYYTPFQFMGREYII